MRQISSIVTFLIVLHHPQSGSRIKHWFGQNAGEQEPHLVEGQSWRIVLEFQSQPNQKMMGQGYEQHMVKPAQPTASFIMVKAEFAFAFFKDHFDSTTLQGWFRVDPDAKWSYPKPWKGSVWGYKVHTLLCRWSQLPVMFLVTPANRQDSLFAITLLALAVFYFGFSISLVRADAAYFTTSLMWFIRSVLNASFVIDYNLRRKGKRFLVTLFFIDQWRFHLRPRAIIERHFAWAKRYFGLQRAHWLGLAAAYQHTALVYSTMLAVALFAHRYQRPELAGSRTRVLALKTLA